MIDRERFESYYPFYGKEVIVQIIDIFLDEYEDRMATLLQNVQNRDFEKLKFNAHSLKNTIANFMDQEPLDHIRTLEKMAVNNESEGMDAVFSDLAQSTKNLFEEVKLYRKELTA